MIREQNQEYTKLLQERKECRLCMTYCKTGSSNEEYWKEFNVSLGDLGSQKRLINTSCVPKPVNPPPLWNPDLIGYWENWQGNLKSKIVVIGQDWGDINYYLKNGAEESGSHGTKPNPTNTNLVELFGSVGITIDPPGTKTDRKELFFTNAILCLKKSGGLQGKTENIWFRNCEHFLKETIENLVRPEKVISLGKKASLAVLDAFHVPGFRNLTMHKLIKGSFRLNGDTALYPVYHCGKWGIWNRKNDEYGRDMQHGLGGMELHKRDWKTIWDSSREDIDAHVRNDLHNQS